MTKTFFFFFLLYINEIIFLLGLSAQPEPAGPLFVHHPTKWPDVYLHYLSVFTSTADPE